MIQQGLLFSTYRDQSHRPLDQHCLLHHCILLLPLVAGLHDFNHFSNFLHTDVVALGEAVHSPRRQCFIIVVLIPISQGGDGEVKVSNLDKLDLFQNDVFATVLVTKHEDEVVEGWRIDLLVLGAREAAG